MSSPAPLVSSPSVASETLTRRAGDLKLLGDSDAIQDVIQTLAAFDAAAAGKSWIDLASDTSAKGISARHRMLLAHAAVEVSRAKDEWLSHLAEEKAERETLARDVMEFAQLFSKVSSEASRERAEREANAWSKESAAPKEEEEGLDEAEDVLFSANVDGHGGSGGVAEAVNGSDVQAAAAKDAVTSSAYLSNTNMGCGATTYASASRRKARPRRWPQVDGPPEMSTQTSCSLPSSTNMPADLGGAGTRGGGGAQPTAPSCDAWSQSPARGAASKGSSSQCSSAMSGGQANSSSSSASPRWKALSGATHATLALRTVTRGSPRARPQAAHQGCAEQPVGGSQTTDADGAASAVAPFGAQNAQQQSDAGGAASLKEGVAAGGADGTEGGPFWTSIIHSSTANRVPFLYRESPDTRPSAAELFARSAALHLPPQPNASSYTRGGAARLVSRLVSTSAKAHAMRSSAKTSGGWLSAHQTAGPAATATSTASVRSSPPGAWRTPLIEANDLAHARRVVLSLDTPRSMPTAVCSGSRATMPPGGSLRADALASEVHPLCSGITVPSTVPSCCAHATATASAAPQAPQGSRAEINANSRVSPPPLPDTDAIVKSSADRRDARRQRRSSKERL